MALPETITCRHVAGAGLATGTAAVLGAQSQKVVATAKHYTQNNQEYQRTSVNEVVDERTHMEMYLPPFEAAIAAGGAAAQQQRRLAGCWLLWRRHAAGFHNTFDEILRSSSPGCMHGLKSDWSRRILDFAYMDYDDQAAHHE